jgi:hypothetical protein
MSPQQHRTTSRVLISTSGNDSRELLRKWANHAAEHGGSFSVQQVYSGNWFEEWVINWPSAEMAASKGGAA